MLRGCGISIVERYSAEGKESTVGMRCHGSVGVEIFIANDERLYYEEVWEWSGGVLNHEVNSSLL